MKAFLSSYCDNIFPEAGVLLLTRHMYIYGTISVHRELYFSDYGNHIELLNPEWIIQVG